ncbi:hypothetical protein FJ651_01265 [Paucihalobacter ruber]|uniref:IPT/TIG domain-containing protein n=1 Tax=Paucihalobacter ruber TaxID=2567861 RepID=A0A506PPD8_9FLAO|nr:IPT/TIG domain-containing protein [Paucihalobacter ruber]TPV35571.1 hypothetical protein FJ651_01265 [Paucihalobacter ruber]
MKKNQMSQTRFVLFLLTVISTIFIQAQPTITNVVPLRVTNGSTVTITGTGFTNNANTTVNFGGSTAGFTITSRSTTEIVLNITGNRSGAPTVVVNGNASAPSALSLIYVAPIIRNNDDSIRINKIYTDFDGFWESSSTSNNSANQPNTSHNLLGFEFNGVTYSTGVNDASLSANNVSFNAQYYRAFSTRGVIGRTHNNLFLAMADLIDGTAHNALGNPNSPNIDGLTSYDVLIDGLNGLDLGTGITNFNTQASIKFTSDNIQPGPSETFFTDNIPDVVFTQIAQPNGSDIYYFSDIDGNVVGTPIRLTLASFSPIGTYRLDLFTFPNNTDIDIATPNGNRRVDQRTRDIRMLGLRFSDFGININNYSNVHSLTMSAGGGADLAFIAYNTESFKIKAPVIISAPNPVNICKLPYNDDVTFSVIAGVDGGGATPIFYQWKKNNIVIPGANSSSYTIPGPVENSDFATYKVEVFNDFGAIVAASAVLKLGGQTSVWNGNSWNNPPNNTSSLVFAADYDSSTNLLGDKLQGCDCKINNDVTITIASNDVMVLQNALSLEPFKPAEFNVPIFDEDGNQTGVMDIPAQQAGKLIIENNGSLVQINETANNSGKIIYKRTATNLKPFDYVYWSSPVEDFDVSGLSSYSTPQFQWNPNVANPNGTFGNWTAASGTMNVGEGYISRVNNANDFTVTFEGAPHNGVYTKSLSGTANPTPSTNYWNLLGNPYPSSINAEDFLLANTAIEGTVRIWTHGSSIGSYSSPFYQNFSQNYNPNDYIIYNGTAAIPPGFNGKIASGQGFFVQGISGVGSVTFNNLQRYKNGLPAYDNSQFYRNSAQDNELSTSLEAQKSVMWLSIINESNDSHYNIAVGYVAGATYNKDRMYDTTLGDENGLLFYSLLDTNEELVIQGRPAPVDISDLVPLGFTAPSSDQYSIVIDQISGEFVADKDIYLEDKFLNITHDLKVAPYNFSSDKGTYNNRFNLRYTNNTLSIDDNTMLDNSTIVYVNDGQLHIKTSTDFDAIRAFDITGKQILSYTSSGLGMQDLATPFSFSNGVYIVQIDFNSGNTINRKIVK